MSDNSDDYLAHADHCLEMAKTATVERLRAGWLTLAENWMAMAERHKTPAASKVSSMLDHIRRSAEA